MSTGAPKPATIFTLTGYDSRGNQTVGIDGKGNSVVAIFDGASRAIESQQLQRYNGLGNQGPTGNSTFQSAGRGLIRTQMLFDGNSRSNCRQWPPAALGNGQRPHASGRASVWKQPP